MSFYSGFIGPAMGYSKAIDESTKEFRKKLEDLGKQNTQPITKHDVAPEDIIRFNYATMRRAMINLDNAKQRNDKRAIENIQRKIAIYQATIDLVYAKAAERGDSYAEDS